MPQDTFTLRLVARELDGALKGGRINKIVEPKKEELSLFVYTGQGSKKLTINASAGDCGVYFTEDTQENPAAPLGFCMLLRKHLLGAKIEEISLDGFERILIIKCFCVSDFSSCERELRCEIMGKYSNVILTEKGTILGAMKTTSIDENFRRAILAGAKYAPPARQEKADPSNIEVLKKLFETPPAGDLSRFLFTHVAGLAPVTAEQIAKGYAGGDLASYVYDFIFSNEISPCVTEGEGGDFFARYVNGAKRFETLSKAQSYFYGKKRAEKLFSGEQRRLLSAVSAQKKKQQKKLAQTREKLLSSASFEENRIKGELLNANLFALKRGMKECELLDFYDETGATRKIALDETLTPAQNAQNYFKKYRKQKRAREFLLPQEEETLDEIDYLESLEAQILSAENAEDLRSLQEEMEESKLLSIPAGNGKGAKNKKQAEISFRKYEKDGFVILAGRNNLQNDRLVKGSAQNDVWLHTQKYHSCHVVIKTEGREAPIGVIEYAAALCVRHSGAKGGGKVPVDYCPVRFVKKPRGAKAGFVTYSEYSTILVDSQSFQFVER